MSQDDRLKTLEDDTRELGRVIVEVRERLTAIETKLSSALWAARAAGAVGGAAMTLLGLTIAWLKK